MSTKRLLAVFDGSIFTSIVIHYEGDTAGNILNERGTTVGVVDQLLRAGNLESIDVVDGHVAINTLGHKSGAHGKAVTHQSFADLMKAKLGNCDYISIFYNGSDWDVLLNAIDVWGETTATPLYADEDLPMRKGESPWLHLITDPVMMNSFLGDMPEAA